MPSSATATAGDPSHQAANGGSYSPANPSGFKSSKTSSSSEPSAKHTSLLGRLTGRSNSTLNEEDKEHEQQQQQQHQNKDSRSPSVKERRRALCIRICIIVSIVMVLFAIIFLPLFFIVLLPKLIQDSFAHQSLGDSSLTFTEISIHNISEGSALFSFGAKLGGVNIPFNLPFEMTKNSDWALADYYNDPVTDKNGDKTWKSMFDAKNIAADFYLHNGRGDIGVRNITLNIGNGAALGAFVGGISRVFIKRDASVVPLFRVNIFTGFKVGAINVKPIPVERVINIGEILLASGFLGEKGIEVANAPAVPLSTLPLKVQPNGVIGTGIKIYLNSPGSPVGLHLNEIGFNLQIDSNTLARVTIPSFSVTAGDLEITIPMDFAISPIGSINAVLAQANIFGGAKTIGATSVSARNEHNQSVAWLDQVLSQVEFRVPLDKIKGNTDSKDSPEIAIMLGEPPPLPSRATKPQGKTALNASPSKEDKGTTSPNEAITGAHKAGIPTPPKESTKDDQPRIPPKRVREMASQFDIKLKERVFIQENDALIASISKELDQEELLMLSVPRMALSREPISPPKQPLITDIDPSTPKKPPPVPPRRKNLSPESQPQPQLQPETVPDSKTLPPPPPPPPPKPIQPPRLKWRRSEDPFFRYVEATYSKTDRFGFVSNDGAELGNLGKLLDAENARAAKWRAMAIEVPVDADLKELVGKMKGASSFAVRMSVPTKVSVEPVFGFTYYERFIERVWKGLPHAWRGYVWYHLITNSGIGLRYAEPMSSQFGLLENYYNIPWRNSKLLDVIDSEATQTFVNHILFMSDESESRISLKRMVASFCTLHPDIGFSPGLVKVAAMLLLTMEEERAYLALLYMYRSNKFNLASIHGKSNDIMDELLFVHERLLLMWAPRLYKKMNAVNIYAKDYAQLWYRTLFFACLPMGYNTREGAANNDSGLLPFRIVVRLWDLFVLYGYDILPVVAVTILKQFEGLLLLCRSRDDILAFLRQDDPALNPGDKPKSSWPASEADEEAFFRLLMRFWGSAELMNRQAQNASSIDAKLGGIVLVPRLKILHRTGQR
ncbi:Rab GTPase-activating protein 1 [Phlyctochytrium planicorne]|nr:Rab GTPase-activating protein 1 [Phlyctochytrium planicorne]